MVAAVTEASLEMFFSILGCENYSISTNEPVSGKWDWKASFTAVCGGTHLSGSYFVKETTSVTYTVFIVYPTAEESTEGWAVIDSFTVS